MENTLLKTHNSSTRAKFIINHFNNRFYEEYILALRERHQYDVRKFNNESKSCVNDVVLIQEENRQGINGEKVKFQNYLTAKTV